MPDVKLWNRDNSGYTTYYVNMSQERDNVRVTVYNADQTIELFDAADDNLRSDVEIGIYKFDATSIAKYVHNNIWDIRDSRDECLRTVKAHFADGFQVFHTQNVWGVPVHTRITLDVAVCMINASEMPHVMSGEIHLGNGDVITFSDPS